jgi:hypothetical protein
MGLQGRAMRKAPDPIRLHAFQAELKRWDATAALSLYRIVGPKSAQTKLRQAFVNTRDESSSTPDLTQARLLKRFDGFKAKQEPPDKFRMG